MKEGLKAFRQELVSRVAQLQAEREAQHRAASRHSEESVLQQVIKRFDELVDQR